jgi:hypothetical protein
MSLGITIRTIGHRSPDGTIVALQQRQYPGANRPYWVGLRNGVVATATDPYYHDPLRSMFPLHEQRADRCSFELEIVGSAIYEDES